MKEIRVAFAWHCANDQRNLVLVRLLNWDGEYDASNSKHIEFAHDTVRDYCGREEDGNAFIDFDEFDHPEFVAATELFDIVIKINCENLKNNDPSHKLND